MSSSKNSPLYTSPLPNSNTWSHTVKAAFWIFGRKNIPRDQFFCRGPNRRRTTPRCCRYIPPFHALCPVTKIRRICRRCCMRTCQCHTRDRAPIRPDTCCRCGRGRSRRRASDLIAIFPCKRRRWSTSKCLKELRDCMQK